MKPRLSIWEELNHLFAVDDGSIPDIYVEPLTSDEVVNLYKKVMSRAHVYDDPTVWSREESRDVPLKQLSRPAELVVRGKIESFRHGLVGLESNGVQLPDLTICVEPNGISFDYKMGKRWGPKEVESLFEFLWDLVQDLPNAKVFHADEGMYEKPTEVFSRVWEQYGNNRRSGRDSASTS
jgi:hypothetical protein